jgi:hypothetical protein
MSTVKPVTKMLVCGVIEIGVRPAASKWDVASVANCRVANLASSARGIETQYLIQQELHPWRGRRGVA